MITLYTKPECPNCETTKQLLTSNDLDYNEVIVGKDVTVEYVKNKFPGAKVVPVIVVGDHRVAGYNELKNMIDNDQIQLLLE
jgi:glutaredoxin